MFDYFGILVSIILGPLVAGSQFRLLEATDHAHYSP